jgi:hypothetical protein
VRHLGTALGDPVALVFHLNMNWAMARSLQSIFNEI